MDYGKMHSSFILISSSLFADSQTLLELLLKEKCNVLYLEPTKSSVSIQGMSTNIAEPLQPRLPSTEALQW